MNIIETVLLITALIFVLWLGSGFWLSSLTISKKTQSEPHIVQLMKDEWTDPIWSAMLERISQCPKEAFTVSSPHGYTIAGEYLIAYPQSNRWVVISHGVTVSKTRSIQYADLFVHLGYNCVLYDHRAHGQSGGRHITYGKFEKDDLAAVINALRKKYEPELIGIHGESMGAAIALMYGGCKKDDVNFYILDCPYDNFFDEACYRVEQTTPLPKPLIRLLGLHMDRFVQFRLGFSLRKGSPLACVPNINAPALFIHCQGDTYIPVQMSTRLYQAKTKGYRQLYTPKDGGHATAYSQDPKAYTQQIRHFLDKVNSLHKTAQAGS